MREERFIKTHAALPKGICSRQVFFSHLSQQTSVFPNLHGSAGKRFPEAVILFILLSRTSQLLQLTTSLLRGQGLPAEQVPLDCLTGMPLPFPSRALLTVHNLQGSIRRAKGFEELKRANDFGEVKVKELRAKS